MQEKPFIFNSKKKKISSST